ncbi:MAG: flagellar export chaperone FlgN [Pirellulales bacterium]
MSHDTEITALLDDLSSVQTELLSVLNAKREMLARVDSPGLEDLQTREASLVERLQSCQDRRQALLNTAAAEDADDGDAAPRTLTELAGRSTGEQRRRHEPKLQAARTQAKLLQHQALANWVIAQKTLIHLSQMLEIIATGGRDRPTYSIGGDFPSTGGVLLNQVG